ncbi:hypothetical protein KEM52_004607 [Ascosphaera acerosa]|nr:hypothetical protein KEM52_004607 [Ascosphaera acerosa]
MSSRQQIRITRDRGAPVPIPIPRYQHRTTATHAHTRHRHPATFVADLSSNDIALICLTAALVYQLLRHFRILPVSLSQAVWHVLVFFLPCQLVRVCCARIPEHGPTLEGLSASSFVQRHLAKSTIMLQYLGIGAASFTRATGLAQLHDRLLTTAARTRSPEPPGLGNWDNSCFQNSIVHGLASLSGLAEYLSHNLHALEGRSDFETHRALRDTIAALNNPRNRGSVLWLPDELKALNTWQQQDAQEYFSKIMEELDTESRDAYRGYVSNPGLSSDLEARRASQTEAETASLITRNPLEGLVAQRVGCTYCGWCEEISLIPFICLTLSLGRRMDNDLQSCLDEYTDLETIEGVECARCTVLKRRAQLQVLKERSSDLRPAAGAADAPASRAAFDQAISEKLAAIEGVLERGEFSDDAQLTKCGIAKNARVQAVKTRQAVIARPPRSLVIHINRSVFDERTGSLMKNSAPLSFPTSLDITEWCLGAMPLGEGKHASEVWAMDPTRSLLPVQTRTETAFGLYRLRAVICHYGRHDAGHYVCFRRFPSADFPARPPSACTRDSSDDDSDESGVDEDERGEGAAPAERWFRLSDEDVSCVSEAAVLAQGGAFMLFYEAEPGSDDGADSNGSSEKAN